MSEPSSASCLLVLDGCIYLNKAPSLFCFLLVCLFACLLVWHLQREGLNSFSTNSLYPMLVTSRVRNSKLVLSHTKFLPSLFYFGLVGTSQPVLSDIATWSHKVFLFPFPSSFSSCVDLNPYTALNCCKL